MLIREVMTPHAEWISPDTLLAEAAAKMRDEGIGCLPVGDNDRLVGMLTDRDIVCRGVAAGLDPGRAKASEAMTKGVTWCFEDEAVDAVLQRMDTKEIHHIPVLNRQKRMTGILTLSDIALRGSQDFAGLFGHLAARDARHHDARPTPGQATH
ncbi:MAG: CBS domain-containing protein [Rhodopila sp.]|nr:CBS domain-containing protein [Rhodopila sp.]